MTERTPELPTRPSRGIPAPIPDREGLGTRDLDRKRERRASGARARAANVGTVERVASALAGGALVVLGLGRRSLGGAALALTGGSLLSRGLTGYCQTYGLLGISTAKGREQSRARAGAGPALEGLTQVRASITIQRPAEELYRAWRNAGILSQTLGDVAEVTAAGTNLQHWKVQGPLGRTLEWDSLLIDERPGELLRWQTAEGAGVPNRGSVSFSPAPGDWGTVVTLHFDFEPPGGALGGAAMKLLGSTPSKLAFKTLRRFKSLMEAGEIPTTGPNPSARASAHAH